MADEEIKEVEEQEVEEKQEEVVETPEKKKEGIIDKIKNIVKSKPEAEAKKVPGGFVAAANEAGWSDEDIESFSADYSDEELLDMIPHLSEEAKEETKEEETEEPEKEEKEEVKDDSQVQELLEKVNKLEQKLGEVDKKTQEDNKSNMVKRVNQLFDEAGKEFEVFGETETLPRFPDGRIIPNSPQFKARCEVVGDIELYLAAGRSVEESFNKALAIYKGTNLTKETKRKVIKELKRSEKSLSAKRVNNESTPKNLTGPDVIKQVLQKQGRI